ncbi:unnamed protein product [Paramecium primaurelia]|uniref:Uncharacterized protein n=1 Tax=Paramecium primaurelia TaxID=5886 RepID=A0A8S1M3T8_PARPR|nr:unnamed protein product [Paramecium primaurelia]
MNLVYLLPLLSRPDKQSVKEELSKKSINELIDSMYLMNDEIERVNKIAQQLRSQPQQLQKLNEELNQKYDILLKDHQKLFQQYQSLLNDHTEVVQSFQSIIEDFKSQTTKDFIKTIKSKKNVLNICQNLDLHISYQQEYQQQINEINTNFQEIKSEGIQMVQAINNLTDADQQQLMNNYDSDAEIEAKKQKRNELISQLLLQIKSMKEKQDNQIKLLDKIYQLSQDELLKDQIKKALDLIQLNQALFKNIEFILPTQNNLIRNYEQKVEFYKKQLKKEIQTKEEYSKKIQEYKINQENSRSQNDTQKTQKEIQSSKYIKYFYDIYLQYLKLILNLIGIQKVKEKELLQQNVEKLKSQLNIQFKDIKELKDQTERLQAGAMVFANYIQEDKQNQILEILNCWKIFFKNYCELLKALSE